MMIDADQESVFQACQARAVNAVALQNDCGFVVSLDRVGLNNLIGKRK